ncbi:MAG: type I 3-dehydroquinate dehydratase [Micrococcales bacterium]|nr:type I 3-dehydroquinate dehydratase [Micrococcales bacterium]
MIVTLGEVEIGTGVPALVVPVCARDAASLVAQAGTVLDAAPDVLEWRLDHLADVTPAAVVRAGRALAEAVDVPVLATFRTAAEGGEREIDPMGYLELYRALVAERLVGAVDVEIGRGEAVVTEMVATAHAASVVVVASAHEIDRTPSSEEIVARLHAMAACGADLCKMAVMPTSAEDVLTLLAATAEASVRIEQPIITMAMGGLGVVTRLAGEVFGSAATFGMVSRASAPGQVDAVALRGVLDLVHAALSVPDGAAGSST